MEICTVYFSGSSSVIFIIGVIVGFITAFIFLGSSNNGKKTKSKEELDVNYDKELEFNDPKSALVVEAEDTNIEFVVINNQTKSLQAEILRIEDNSTLNYLDESSPLTSLNESPPTIFSTDFNKINNGLGNNPTLYFSIPSDHSGRFDLGNKKDIYDSKCHYSIKELSNNRGELSFLSSDKDFRALDDYTTHLMPVCEIVNFNEKSNAKNIRMVEKGIVNFENGSWVVDKNNKVKIRFI
jgi:hypothetical protein